MFSLYVCIYVFTTVFFCFKQNTAYEMRISDLSSDVCSSDLLQPAAPRPRARMNQMLGILDSYAYRTLVWDIYVERSEGRAKAGAPDEAKIDRQSDVKGKSVAVSVDLGGRSIIKEKHRLSNENNINNILQH